MKILFIIYLMCFCQFGYSQLGLKTHTKNDSVLFSSDFFDKDQILELKLEFDIKKFITEKFKENYFPANLSYYINDTVEIRKSVRIKSRGEFRKKHCYFPPYWLNIKNTNLQDDSLLFVKKIKIVSHCKHSEGYKNYLIKEYLIYKIFNIISEYSFKVRLLEIKYIDTGRNNKSYECLAFMIEPEELLNERLKSYALKMDKINYEQTEIMHTTIMSIFQYMIGNTDYTIIGRHNIKLSTSKDYTKQSLIPIPYDFDYSGFVNTHYAIPQLGIDIESVTERYFYGMCRTDDVYNSTLDIFRKKKDEIFFLINSCKYVDKKTKKYVIAYLEDFYNEIEKPDFIKYHLRTTCE